MLYLCQLVFTIYQFLNNVEVVCIWHILQTHIKSCGLQSLENQKDKAVFFLTTMKVLQLGSTVGKLSFNIVYGRKQNVLLCFFS